VCVCGQSCEYLGSPDCGVFRSVVIVGYRPKQSPGDATWLGATLAAAIVRSCQSVSVGQSGSILGVHYGVCFILCFVLLIFPQRAEVVKTCVWPRVTLVVLGPS
jgi:hypothetical protein